MMTPRPFYRWKSFWLGLCVLVFMGWAWWWSLTNYRAIWLKDGEVRWQMNFAWGAVNVERIEWGPSSLAFDRIGTVASKMTPADWRPLPPAFERDSWKRDDSEGFPRWSVAFWCLALLFLAVWCSWLFWRWKREQKKSS